MAPNDPQLTLQKCASECDRLLGPGVTAYVGTESGTQCYCGRAEETPDSARLASPGSCSSRCSGNATQVCGGNWLMSVFQMGTCTNASSMTNVRSLSPGAPTPAPGTLVPTITPIRHRIERNLIINGYNGVWALDHDDGSSFYNDSSNVLLFGGCKNYKGDHKTCGPDNLILYPGIDSRSSGGRSCQTNDNAGNYGNVYEGNDCVQWDGQFYTFSGGSLDPAQIPFTARNRFYSPGAKFNYGGHTLSDLQRAGLDIGSTVAEIPPTDALVELARQRLGMS